MTKNHEYIITILLIIILRNHNIVPIFFLDKVLCRDFSGSLSFHGDVSAITVIIAAKAMESSQPLEP